MVQVALKSAVVALTSLTLFSCDEADSRMQNNGEDKAIATERGCDAGQIRALARAIFADTGPVVSVRMSEFAGIHAPADFSDADSEERTRREKELARDQSPLASNQIPAECTGVDGDVSYEFSVVFNTEMLRLMESS